MTNSMMKEGNPNQSCIDSCNKCVQICEECFTMCLNEEDVKERIHCIKSLQDCAEVCSLAVKVMARDSHMTYDLCRFCAKVCEDCAEHCGKFEDEHCQICAKTCRECAEECRKMAAM